MSDKKQTAVEWLMSRFESGDMYNVEDAQLIKDQALWMEQDQLIDAHIEGQRVFDKHPHTQWTTDQAEQYYKGNYETEDSNETTDRADPR